ncbi:MAG TPA: DEAD/DEAH box helicase [Chloroflexia bacterium]|nr:DEAD/DEAH box helicase [Chloroflexia bacterium]
MDKIMNLTQLIGFMRTSPMFQQRITSWHDIPAREARTAPFPGWLDPHLEGTCHTLGIRELYSHQREALDAVHRGEHVVVVTPTASGKTLCYNLPVLDSILKDPEARALYLFPTKALAQDQLANLHAIVTAMQRDIKTFTYDGDTPPTARKLVRTAGHVVISNPDMLHTGVLPHHTKWVRLFENLRYVVIDEVHNYRGVFGSHVANVMRRLLRICEFYGSRPQFILSSATIANPQQLAERVTGVSPITLVDNNGAPQGPKTFVFYNPPVVNKELGLRRSKLLEATDIASQLLANDIQTIVFGSTRTSVEVLLTYLRDAARRHKHSPDKVRGYRGGYLPNQRREIERGLRDGTVRTVVSTNALELGIDIGALEAAVLVGYPGTVASTWQQAGRAGRRSTQSLAVMVAGSSPLDQFLVNNPEYFFNRSPENGLINPDNLFVLMSHLQCAAFELPFREDEGYGTHSVSETAQMLDYLEESFVVRHTGGMYHWSSENFPAEKISLRTAASENFVIVENTEPSPRIIGEMDRFSVLTLLHEEAIYLHEGQQFHVDKLDWDEQKAYVRAVDADYYTDANLAVTLKVLDIVAPEPPDAHRNHGEVMVSAQATIYKKIKLHTHENVGWGKIHLPEQELHTTSYWLCVPPMVSDNMPGKDALQAGLVGLGNLLSQMAPLYLMCDPHDLGVVPQVKNPFTGQSTIFLYDSYPGGIGFSQKLYDMHATLLEAAANLLRACGCEDGCPSCVGPAMEIGPGGKRHTLDLINGLLVTATHKTSTS